MKPLDIICDYCEGTGERQAWSGDIADCRVCGGKGIITPERAELLKRLAEEPEDDQ